MTDDTLHGRVTAAVAEADEILHRHGPVNFVRMKMDLAAKVFSEEDHNCSHIVGLQDFAEAEEEVRRSGSKEALDVLINGYTTVLKICNQVPAGTSIALDKAWVYLFDQRMAWKTYREKLAEYTTAQLARSKH